MAGIPEDVVAAVVAETSERMAEDPNYAQVAVGALVQGQPHLSRWLTANDTELGGEGVVHAVFHAQVLAECVRRHRGRRVPVVRFADLDAVASEDAMGELERAQTGLHGYITSNVESEAAMRILAHAGLALCRVALR